MGLSSIADKFITINDVDQLSTLLGQGDVDRFPILFLGGGSNVLFLRRAYPFVAHLAIKSMAIVEENENHVWIKAGAGEQWHDLVTHCVAKGWGGIENLSLIPGTVGAAPMQNIGAYGVEIKEVFHSLEAMNRRTLELRIFDATACQFGYRESVFKNQLKNQYVITSVTLKLVKNPEVNTSYGAIQIQLLSKGISNPTIREVSEAIIAIRQSKLPNPTAIGNAGSFFKNPVIIRSSFDLLETKYPTIPHYPQADGHIKVPAGWLIEQCGWKGKRLGNVGVHDRQALVLVNYGGATGEEIKQLSMQIQTDVLAKFDISIHTEVNFV